MSSVFVLTMRSAPVFATIGRFSSSMIVVMTYAPKAFAIGMTTLASPLGCQFVVGHAGVKHGTVIGDIDGLSFRGGNHVPPSCF